MAALFERTEINGMVLANRFVRSATWEGMATEAGGCTPKLVQLMADLAEGGVGLIITSHAYVLKEGQAGPWQLGVYKDGLLPGLKEMTQAVHARGGKTVIQLAHAGMFAMGAEKTPVRLDPLRAKELAQVWSRALSVQDIRRIVDAFGEAASRAREAGFDGVQIHSAHGYLLAQFLSPYLNYRTDDFGGDIANRARLLVDVYRRVRSEVGPDYPVLVKINSQDFLEGGLPLEDSVRAGVMLAEEGIDAIELSGGVTFALNLHPSRAGINREEKEAYFQQEARAYREKVTVPLILVGGIRSYSVAERLVEEGVADYISMSRPFLREPDLINRWKSGDRVKAACLSDNKCFDPARAGEGIYCVVERERKRGHA
jgi:2,4-dienoyl-CoA reductase-like NADH-dependent reductase (Old Yellow Enzyme family)